MRFLIAFVLMLAMSSSCFAVGHFKSDYSLRTYLMDGKRESKIVAVNCGELLPGDIIQVNAQFQATNDSGTNVHLASQIRLDVQYGGTEGVDVHPQLTENITPNMHHSERSMSVSYEVTEYIADGWVKLIGWTEQGCLLDDRVCLTVTVFPAN